MLSDNSSPFGKDLQKYWDNRYKYFSKFDDGIQIDEEGLYSVTPEDVATRQASNIKGDSIIDAFGCVGGNAIAFAKAGKKVYTIEINSQRLNMAKNNAKIYGVENRIEFIHGDFFKEIGNLKADAVYLDPPWGGPEYKKLGYFVLKNFSPDGNKILDRSFETTNNVIIRVPTIFKLDDLKKFERNYHVIDDVLENKIISRTVYFK